jgi:hypothetical protein
MDFSKAFDKVCHSLLTHKLHHYGIRDKTNRWIQNFLRDRNQSVVVEDETSKSIPVSLFTNAKVSSCIIYKFDKCVSQERPFRIPCWRGCRILCLSTWAMVLLVIMCSINLGKTTRWIQSFLRDPNQSIVVEGETSNSIPVESDVP